MSNILKNYRFHFQKCSVKQILTKHLNVFTISKKTIDRMTGVKKFGCILDAINNNQRQNGNSCGKLSAI